PPSSPPPALRPEHAVALLAYTLQEPLYREFNAAVREAGRSREKYLGALCVLHDAQPRRCHRVYRGVQGIRFTAQQHQSGRFGRFTSTSLQNKTSHQLFGQDTTFLVETCYGARISNFSSFPGEEEVLVPPFESFEVTDVARDGNRALIQLRSQDARSTYNCELVKGDAPAAGWGGTVGWPLPTSSAGKGGSCSWGGGRGEFAFGRASLHVSRPLCPGVCSGGDWQRSVARHGTARHGTAQHGTARRSTARH
uniref:NAD(P)(+)--arginine ADP-ribosyltransferase n=1 Tax=Strix occidentalis caurina TaxID=311401 RepID=A0A8D0FM77_STROC